jgi:hypothetical protein
VPGVLRTTKPKELEIPEGEEDVDVALSKMNVVTFFIGLMGIMQRTVNRGVLYCDTV